MRGAREARWLGVLALTAALLVGCREREPPDRAVTQTRPRAERIEVRVDARAWSTEAIERQIVQTLEAGLRDVPNLSHISAEARPGRARVQLELSELGDARAEVARRIQALQAQLPPDVDRPTLAASSGPQTQTMRWFLHSETVDPLTLSRLHASLVARCEALAGVRWVDGCAPRRRVIVELDPDRLAALRLDAAAVADALRTSLAELPGFDDARRGVAALRALELAELELSAHVSLGELAAIRYGFGEPTCVAASAGGLVTSAAVLVDGPDTLTALRSALADAARELPPEVELRRFGPEDTLLALSMAAGTDLEDAAELIGGGFASDRPNWLVEVGVAADPCVGAGLRIHLSVPGPASANAGLIASLRGVPGVGEVEVVGDPASRRALWLLGPDHERLATLARELARARPKLVAHVAEPTPELEIRHDRQALAALGLSVAQVARQIELGRAGGIELGELFEDDGTPLPLVLRVTDPNSSDPDQPDLDQPDDPQALAALELPVGDAKVPVSAVAQLELVARPNLLCRRDGQPAVRLDLLAPSEAEARAAIAAIVAELPPGYALDQ